MPFYGDYGGSATPYLPLQMWVEPEVATALTGPFVQAAVGLHAQASLKETLF